MAKPKPPVDSEVTRVGKFSAVGIVNTGIDFFLFNFCSKFLRFSLLQSNLVSTTIAMIFSFFANRQLVFRHKRGSQWQQAAIFFVVTAFGLYVLQSGIIALLTVSWPAPLELMVTIIRRIGINWFTDAFYINNGAKAAATVASLIWNYVMYKKVVFR